MVCKYLDMSPPVAAALKAGCPVVAMETGCFCRIPYPKNLRALEDAEQSIWQKNCVPCPIAVINGRMKAGLTPQEKEALMQHRVVCTRGELPALAARGLSSAALPSAAVAVARLAGIVPVVLPGFQGALEDVDALAVYDRLVFCGTLTDEAAEMLRARSVSLVTEDAAATADAWLIQRELDAPEATVCPVGSATASQCAAACDAALWLKKKTEYT